MARKKKGQAGATAAVQVLRDAGVEFAVREYEHVAGETSFGAEAAAALGRPAEQVFKTLMVQHGKEFAVCIVPVSGQLSLKRVATALGWKSAHMADPAVAQRRSGYVVGGISPLGQKIAHPTVLDDSAQIFETILVSGGKRGLDVELTPADLLKLTGGQYAAVAAS